MHLAALLAGTLAATSAQPVEVPFRIGEDAIIVDVTVNGTKASLMYDTGFSGSVIVGDNLDVGKPTGTMKLVDFVGSFDAKTVPLKTLKIGERAMTTTDMEIVKQPTDHYTLSYGTHCDGILGFQPFGATAFQINFEKQKFVFFGEDYDLTKVAPDNKTTFMTKLLPIGVNSMMMSVEMENGSKLHMALDTGNAHYAVTHKDSLEEAKVWPEGKKADFMGQSMVASGAVDTFHVRLNKIKIFGVPVPECVFGVIDLPSSSADQDGTVGFEFLKNFNITVDMKHRRVLFENFSGKVADEQVADTGVLAFPDPRTKRLRVAWVIPGSPAEKAGIKRGDDVLSIDGSDAALMTFRQAGNMMKGTTGSKVKLDLSRNGQLMRLEVDRQVLVNSTG
ncbi:MAG: aspartyl protease family protein [Armatimonadetes bacterium]|nr:aspartyl protease family protein [Armatimonadota bacterium]